MELSERLQLKRKELGYTQEEIAEKINVSRQTISNWETGRTLPDINSLIMISDVYGISLDELIKGDNQMIKKLSKDSKEAERWFVFTSSLSSLLSIFLNIFASKIQLKIIVICIVLQTLILCIITLMGWPFLKDHQRSVQDNIKEKVKGKKLKYIFTEFDFIFIAAILSGIMTIFTLIVFYM